MSRREVLKTFERYADESAERVDYGIEHYRKGYFELRVTDKDGNPVKGAKLKINQSAHEFKYGANIFMLDELESDEKNAKYKQYFKDAFNMATLPFYWSDVEPRQGALRYDKDSEKIYRRPPIDLCMEFCEQNGIEPREHALAYDYMFPKWVRALPVEEIKKLLRKRYKEISERYAHRIPTIEVTNEGNWPLTMPEKTALYEHDSFIEWCFREADKYFPDNKLSINDNCVFGGAGRDRDIYYMQIERALSRGVRIDSIGMQFHVFVKQENEICATENTQYNPHYHFRILDRYADFRKPLQITEVTIPAYSTEAEDEQIQAEIINHLYRIWFSHPNMEQIIYWNLVDGYAAFAPQGDMTAGENIFHGGLLRFDFTPKPAYYVIKDLFGKEWHTEARATTNEDGIVEFKGFFGDYTVEINGKEYAVSARKNMLVDIFGRRSISIVTD